MNNYDPIQSLNQQIKDNEIPNVEPISLEVTPKDKLIKKLNTVKCGSFEGEYFVFTASILQQYRFNTSKFSLEYEYTYKDAEKKEVITWITLCELLIVQGFVIDNDDRRFYQIDLFNHFGEDKNFIIPVDLDSKFMSALYSKGVTKHYNRTLNSKIEEFILRVIRIDNNVTKGVRPYNGGWLDSETYFYPNENYPVFIGANLNKYYYIQSKDKRTISGNLFDWQNKVAKYAIGNPMLEFAIYSAFVGMAMPELSISMSYGFHIYSYQGGTFKSLALSMAGSVVGNGNYVQKQWKQTGNNLDLLCALSNNSLLVLDEMKQLNRQIALSDIIMQIGNNQGRGRMAQDGVSSREQLRWQLCYLSSGNKATEQYILEREGGELMGAEETRLYNLQMMTPTNFHDHAVKSSYAKHLHTSINECHGIAGYEFISNYLAHHRHNKEWLIRKYQEIQTEFITRINKHSKEIGSTEIHDRIVPAFASVAVAGALAKHLGILHDGFNPVNTVWQILLQYLIERGGNVDEQAWLAKLYDVVSKDRNKYFYHAGNKPKEIYGFIETEMGAEIAYIVRKCLAEIYGYNNFKKAKSERNFLISIGVLHEETKEGKDIIMRKHGIYDRGVKVTIERLSELVNM
ncbi:MAG: DUF927 domain-containing protein [Sphingobacteriaceae bacterium]|nr:DUF927 domain-containing protein [Sphingobacteriaceae bacterium]